MSNGARPSAAARGYGRKWQRKRRRYLREHPICECSPECQEPATDVHHRDGLGPLGPRGYDDDNLQALAHAHHSAITFKREPRRRQAEQHPGLV